MADQLIEALVSEREALHQDRIQLAERLEAVRAGAAVASPHDDRDLAEQLQHAVKLQDHHLRDAQRARAERDDALLRLLDAEQRLAAATSAHDVAGPSRR